MVEHWTVESEDGHVFDLTSARLYRLHPVDYPLPAATLRHWRADLVQHSHTGWRVAAGWLSAHEGIILIVAPDGSMVAITRSVSRQPMKPWLAVGTDRMASLRTLLVRLHPDEAAGTQRYTEQHAREVDRLWRVAIRHHEIAQTLPPPAEPRPGSRENREYIEQSIMFTWSCFATESEAAQWRDVVGNRLAAESLIYAQAGRTPQWSAPWLIHQVSLDEAIDHDARGWSPDMVVDLTYLLDPEESYDEASHRLREEWLAAGIPPRLAVLACAAGFSPAEAQSRAGDLDETGLRALLALQDVDLDGLYINDSDQPDGSEDAT